MQNRHARATRLLWSLALVTIFSTTALRPAAAAPPPDEQLREAAAEIIDALRAAEDRVREEPRVIFSLVDEHLVPLVDFERASQWVLGRHWRTASAEQRGRFIEEFRSLLVRFYGSALAEYVVSEGVPEGNPIRFLPTRLEDGATRATVRSEVRTPGGAPVAVNYLVSLRDGRWQVYDVSVDGISMVTNYRSSFDNEIRRGGMDGLLETLAQRNRELLEQSETGNAAGSPLGAR